VYRVGGSRAATTAAEEAGAEKHLRCRRPRAVAWTALVLAAGAAASACSDFGSRELPPRIDVSQVFGRAPLCRDMADAGADTADAGDAGAVDAGVANLGAGKVVIISVDGLRPDALFAAPAPHILAQACRGAYTWQARTIVPSLTLPSHASMIAGVPAEVHGIFHDDNLPGRGFIVVPTVLGLGHQAGKRVVVVVGKEKLGQLAPEADRDVFRWIGGSDDAVVDGALAEVAAGFDLLFVHLPGVDYDGHADGWFTGAYLAQVRATDQAVGRLLDGLPAGVTVILTADHGGAGYGHGSASAEDVSIPWIAVGPGIAAGHALAQPVQTMDTAATVAQLLDLQLPPTALGRPVAEAWAGSP
jgi:hypothetical protein